MAVPSFSESTFRLGVQLVGLESLDFAKDLVELREVETVLGQLLLDTLGRFAAHTRKLLAPHLLVKLRLESVAFGHGHHRARFRLVCRGCRLLLFALASLSAQTFHLVVDVRQNPLQHVFWGLRTRV